MIEITRRHEIAIVTMVHAKANAMDLEFLDALSGAVAECASSSARAMVVTARGPIFSAGVDLLRVLSGGAAYLQEFIPALSSVLETIFTFPKPVVAAINGHAFAGGCILACAADRRLMARGSGRIGIPELLVGVPFPTVPIEIVRYAVPPQHVPTLVYSGDTLLPDAALAHGVVDTVVDADRLLDEAIAAAERLAALPAAAFALAKNQLREPAMIRMRDGKRRFDPIVTEMWSTPETLDAIRGYVARTFKK